MATTFKFKADGSQYARGLEKMRGQTKKFASGVGGLIRGAFAFAGIAGLKNIVDDMVQITRHAERLGVGVEAFQKLSSVAKTAGIDTDRLADAMKDLNVRAQDAALGSESIAEVFEGIGLDPQKFSRMLPEQQFYAFADAIKEADGNMKRFTADEFGDAMFETLPILALGSEALKELMGNYSAFTEEQAEAAKEAAKVIGDTMSEFKTSLSIWTAEAINALLYFVGAVRESFLEIEKISSASTDYIGNQWKALKAFMSGNLAEGVVISAIGSANLEEDMKPIIERILKAGETAKIVVDVDEGNANEVLTRQIAAAKKILELNKKKQAELAKRKTDDEKIIDSLEKQKKIEEEIKRMKSQAEPGDKEAEARILAKEVELLEEQNKTLSIQKKLTNDLLAIRKKIAEEVESREEVDMTEEELLNKAIIERQKLEQELIDLKLKAMEDGKKSAEEEAEIAKKRLEVEQAITKEKERADAIDKADSDARDDAADTRKDIRQERRDREEIGMDEGQILARRKEELKAAQATQAALRKAAESDGITGQEEKDIAEGQLAIENLKTEIAGIQQGIDSAAPETPGGPSIISSSLASIGGGGGTAMFTADPLLSENQKQTRVLEEIRTALQPSDGLETGTLQIPEL